MPEAPKINYDALARGVGRGADSALLKQAERIEELEASLRGIINHWNEFGEMMFANKDDYGLGERLDAAAKLVG